MTSSPQHPTRNPTPQEPRSLPLYTQHADATSFLAVTQQALLAQEAVNGLMLGLSLRLAAGGSYGDVRPFLATIQSTSGLELAAFMTPPHKLLLFAPGEASTEALQLLVDGLLSTGYAVPAVLAPEALGQQFASVWCAATGATARPGMRQRVYELRRVEPVPLPSGTFRVATPADLPLVREWGGAFHSACFREDDKGATARIADGMVAAGDIFLWVDGTPVSMAGRTRPTPHGQTVSLVYTPPECRRRGYATAVVAKLSQLLLDEGREFCSLYTDLGNPTSNRIYQEIGYRPVADVADIHLDLPQ